MDDNYFTSAAGVLTREKLLAVRPRKDRNTEIRRAAVPLRNFAESGKIHHKTSD